MKLMSTPRHPSTRLGRSPSPAESRDEIGAEANSGGKPLATSGAHLLTQQQIRRIQTLPDGHTVISAQGRALIVRQADGQLARIRPSGRLVTTTPVQRVRSYLNVRG